MVNGRNPESGEQVVRTIESNGGEAVFIGADMLIKEQARNMVRKAIEHSGQVDILVSSAGAGASVSANDTSKRAASLFADSDPEDIADFLTTNTLRKLNPVHAVVDHMISRQSGAVLIMTSQGGRVATPGQTALSLHAGGLILMPSVVARELAR